MISYCWLKHVEKQTLPQCEESLIAQDLRSELASSYLNSRAIDVTQMIQYVIDSEYRLEAL